MAQANVAREPSMEEILASIRKIIESNDPTEELAPESDVPIEPEERVSNAEQPTRPASLLNRISDANAEEIGAVNADAPHEVARPIEPQVPLRPAISKTDSVGQSSEDPEMMKPIVKQGDALASVPQAPPVEAGSRSEESVSNEEAAADNEVVALPIPENSSPNGKPDDPVANENPSAQSNDDAGESRALISPTAGARVAASFGNLNHALTNGPTRSFDEIAEDMLRPMLQQWMDDNLPTLVERLVREEIERVARGR